MVDDKAAKPPPKKVFAPNIPSATSSVPASKPPAKTFTPNIPKKNFPQKDFKKPSPKKNIIKTAGIFSEGIQITATSKRDIKFLPELSNSGSVTKTKVISQEVSDSFIEQTEFLDIINKDTSNVFNKCRNYPVTLPLRVNISEYIGDNKIEATKTEDEHLGSSCLFNNVFMNPPANDEYFLMQVPDTLPCFNFNATLDDKTNEVEDAEEPHEFHGTFHTSEYASSVTAMPEGEIGQLELLSSGKVRLRIGHQCFQLSEPACNAFLQQIFVADEKEMTSLGRIKEKYLFTWQLPTKYDHEV